MRWLYLLLMCSTVSAADVTQFGAIPDDGRDDWFAIQSAIEQSRPGETITFPAGTFELSKNLDPKGRGRIFTGATQLQWQGEKLVATTETILRATGNDFAMKFAGSDLTLKHLTFANRGIFCSRDNNVMVEKLTIDHCHFKIEPSGHEENGVCFTTGLADSAITNCLFDPIAGENGIYGYNWRKLTIANNLFLSGGEGIHLVAHLDSSSDLLIEQNYFAHLHRMGIEIQGGGRNTIVQDNYYELPVMSADREKNNDTFAYSIVSDRSIGTKVLRNTSIAPERPDGVGVRIIFELGGKDLVCQDNYSVDGNHVIAVNGAGATGTVSGNRISGFNIGPLNNEANGTKALIRDNGPDVKLSWDVNRGKPGPDRRVR